MSEPLDIAHDGALERSGWLRAAVLGANDGIVSTASLIVGVAAADASATAVLTAGIAGLVAGALSMAAGEYVSVSSQRDLEEALRRHEARLTDGFPEVALTEVAIALQLRGIAPGMARAVAQQLGAESPVEAGLNVKYGLSGATRARPLQAALASAAAFAGGALVPLLGILVGDLQQRMAAAVGLALLALALSGALAARLGGAPVWRGALRVVLGGGLAMALSALIGRAVGAVV
ncbi:MAG: VIT1/CCC1 transporter family protein [Deltaproteobacteria bacterium]|nr:VIT1/CCC1 transporter family protein [Deltaproteobacteria bacterium]